MYWMDGQTDSRQTDRGINNIPIAFLKKRGDKKIYQVCNLYRPRSSVHLHAIIYMFRQLKSLHTRAAKL